MAANKDLPTLQQVAIFREELDSNMKFLATNGNKLGEKDWDFASSLCDFYDKYDSLSNKQCQYAMKFWRELKNLGSTGAAEVEDKEAVVTVDTSELLELFNKARETLKFPKLVYPITSHSRLRIYPRIHRNPGNIAVFKDEDRVDGANTEVELSMLVCEINKDGNLFWNREASIPLRLLTKNVITEPKAKLVTKGKEFKLCCYCGNELTAPASLHAGYGPICASNWGLPWGDTFDPEKLVETL